MKKSKGKRVLVLGIGNSSRSDDGLGWWMIDRLREMNVGADLEYRFQLNLEDADYITRYDQVLFIDATSDSFPLGYRFSKINSNDRMGTFSHAVSPGLVKHLANNIFGAIPQIFMLEICGEHWKIGEGLSEIAIENGLSALRFLKKQLEIQCDLKDVSE